MGRGDEVVNSLESKKAILFDTNMMPWEKRFNDKLEFSMYSKRLVQDPDTDIMIRINRYPAGFITPLHTHHCAHGMYVMDGTLKTENGCYGPGNFIWWPEGSLAEHGATAITDVTVFFITNKLFDICYKE